MPAECSQFPPVTHKNHRRFRLSHEENSPSSPRHLPAKLQRFSASRLAPFPHANAPSTSRRDTKLRPKRIVLDFAPATLTSSPDERGAPFTIRRSRSSRRTFRFPFRFSFRRLSVRIRRRLRLLRKRNTPTLPRYCACAIRAARAAMRRSAHTPRLPAASATTPRACARIPHRRTPPTDYSRACADESKRSSRCRCKSSCTRRSNRHTI